MSRTVLVVDDNPLVREMVKSMLEARGILVAAAKDGTEALELFSQAHCAAAIIDVDMPGPNGVEVCRSLHQRASEQGRTVAVWLMTGVERPGLADAAKAAGAIGLLLKPFSTEQLISRVEEMFAAAPVAS